MEIFDDFMCSWLWENLTNISGTVSFFGIDVLELIHIVHGYNYVHKVQQRKKYLPHTDERHISPVSIIFDLLAKATISLYFPKFCSSCFSFSFFFF